MPPTPTPLSDTATPAPAATATSTPAETPAEVAASDGTAAAPLEQSVYEDPSGRFTVPIPTNWKVESVGSHAILRDPDDAITVYVVVVPAEDTEKAIADAWAVVDPSFSLTPAASDEVPSPPGIDETLEIDYDAGSEQMVVAFGKRVKDRVYALLFDASMEAVMRRDAQLKTIMNGFTVQGMEQVDLTGMEPKALTAELLAELDAYITEAMRLAKVPGAAVAIVQNDEVVYLKGFGVREMGKDDPVTPDTLMMVGSTGKTMTTMMMATVVDDGDSVWSTPAAEILPTFAVADPELTQKITMRNLVCNCSGVPRRDLDYILDASNVTAEDIVASLRNIEFLTGFGEAFQYSNQMVATGGYLAALAGGGSADDLYGGYLAQMYQRVFDPIGMTHTTFDFDEVAAAPDHATPHGVNVLGEYSPAPLSDEQILMPVTPAGGAWSTARDMSRYLITELNEGISPDGVRVVSAENLRVTWEPQVAVDADTSYGLGWYVDEYKGLRLLQHVGNTSGFSADLAFLPEAGLGIMILSNARYATPFTNAIRYRLFELAFEQPAEQDEQFRFALESAAQNAQGLSALLKPVDRAAVEPFLGTFSNETVGDATLSMEEDRLILDFGELDAELRPVEMEPGMNAFIVYGGPLYSSMVELRPATDDAKPSIVLHRLADTYMFTAK